MNGRAFVKSVQPHSPQAARAGVLPRDSIQFASLYHTDFDDTEDFGVSSDFDQSATWECESRTMNCDDHSWPKAWIPCNRHFCRHRP
jgi:hypothetical protein